MKKAHKIFLRNFADEIKENGEKNQEMNFVYFAYCAGRNSCSELYSFLCFRRIKASGYL